MRREQLMLDRVAQRGPAVAGALPYLLYNTLLSRTSCRLGKNIEQPFQAPATRKVEAILH